MEHLTNNDWKYLLSFNRRDYIRLIKSQLEQGLSIEIELFDKIIFHLEKNYSYLFNCWTFENTIYYRGRIYSKENDTNFVLDGISAFNGYGTHDSFVPPASLTPEGRVNEKGTVFLYVGDRERTAVVETVKNNNDIINVAEIKMNKQLKLFNACHVISGLAEKDEKQSSWLQGFVLEIAECFYSVNDKLSDYIICQYIGKLLIRLGYDGICYFSSKSGSLHNEPYFDFAIFNYGSCEPISSKLVKVNDMRNIYGEIQVEYTEISKNDIA